VLHIATLPQKGKGTKYQHGGQSEPAATKCISWPFCPLDGVHFFIWRKMGFITVHFFLLLTTVPFSFFSLVLGRFSPGPDLLPCSLSYPPKYCTNLDTLFIIPY
jgi:hypothetical protein